MGASVCSLILPNFFLGSRLVLDEASLKAYSITASLSVCEECPSENSGVKVLQFEIEDSPEQDLLNLLEKGIRFILENRLQGETVLVHCAAGVSRSATFVASYLMTTFDWSIDETLEYMVHCRSCVNPNPGFRAQLLRFENEIKPGLQQKILDEYGDEYTKLLESDKSGAEELRNGAEITFNVSTEIGGDFKSAEIGLHSISNVRDLLRLSAKEFELSEENLGIIRLDTDEELSLDERLMDVLDAWGDSVPVEICRTKAKRRR